MTEFKETELDERAINMAKVLSADAVEKAGSGHPGSPVSLAPVAYTLYQHFIKHDPNDPNWEGRDRFILSGGHASLTQYVQLYFSGYGLTLDDLKNFRGGADTRTPGHPEYGLTPGIEMTTGPLGQGFASAIAIIAILITMVVYFSQNFVAKKQAFSMNALHRIEKKQLHGFSNFIVHFITYVVVGISILPQLIVFFCAQDQFVEGISAGAVKG